MVLKVLLEDWDWKSKCYVHGYFIILLIPHHYQILWLIHKDLGVKIGENCHFSPYVLIDLVYPELVEIGDNVTIGSNSMIFAHINPTANLNLKKTHYPRKVAKVTIKSGAVINPGAIITAGVTIGKNSIVSIGSAVFEDIPDNCVVLGNPARVVKKLDFEDQ